MNSVPPAGWCSCMPSTVYLDVNSHLSQLLVPSKLQEKSQMLLGLMLIRGTWPDLHHNWSRSPVS